MFNKVFIFLVLILIGLSQSFFSPDSAVITLDSQAFEKKVLDSNDIWLILFYSENEEFNTLKPEYEKAALALKDMFHLGAIDAKTSKSLLSKYKITYTPTMKFFGTNKDEEPKDFSSKQRATAIIEKMFLKVQSFANTKLNITDDEAVLYSIEHNPDIVQLNDKNFDDTIKKNELMWLILFYSPKCGICKKLLPQFVKAHQRVKDKAVFAIIDGLINRQSARRFGLSGYPFLIVYSPGFGNTKKVEEYNGPRDENGIVDYILKKNELYGYVREPPQITNQDMLKQECINKEGYCIITLFPHIMKSSAKERNTYIGSIKRVSQNYNFKPAHFVWAQEGDFHRFEKNIKINKYPVTIGVDFKKRLFSYKKYNDNFDHNSLNSFIQNLLDGKEKMMNYAGGLEISETEKWDRKDYMNDEL